MRTRQWATACLLVAGLAIVAMALMSAPASAQTLYGSVVGTVTDPQGYRVPGASVVITNTGNGLKRDTTTNNEGEYNIVNVQPGTYDVRISMGANFKAYEKKAVNIQQGDIARVDTQLQAGSVTDVINVVSDSELLQTDKADTSTKLDSVAYVNLPLNAYRNYQSLIVLVPGSQPEPGSSNAETDYPQRTLNMNVNGQGGSGNQTRTDGATNTSLWLPTHNPIVSPAETIETVNISTSSMDAEQGGAAGAAITVTTKSGTNAFKGSAFEFFNSEKLNAPDFNFSSTPEPNEPIMRQTFGGTIGGPLKRNRLFFFGSYEGYISRTEQFEYFDVPDERARNGDFSHFVNTNGTLQRIGDPFTGSRTTGAGRAQLNYTGPAACATCATGLNVMDPAKIDPIAKRILALYPEANIAGTGAGGFSDNYRRPQKNTTDRHNYDFKVNLNRSNTHQIWWKFSYMHALVDDRWVFPLPAVSGDGGLTRVYQPTVGHTWVLSPTLTFDSTLGISIIDQDVYSADSFMGNYALDVLGIPGTNNQNRTDIPFSQNYQGLPAIATGFQGLGNTPTWAPILRNEKTISVSNNLTKFAGNHEIRGGYFLNRFEMDQWQPERANPRGSFSATGGATRMTGQTSNFYNNWGAFMHGLVGTVGKSVQNEIFSVYEWQHSFFVRDRWNLTKRLTLDVGLRYELYPIMQRAARGIEMVDPQTLEVVIGGRGPDIAGTAFDEGDRNLGLRAQKDLFVPRVGGIFRINDKTVARAGYGLSYDATGWSGAFRGDRSLPAAANASFPTPTDGNQNWGWNRTLADGIPFIVLPDNTVQRIPLDLSQGTQRTPTPDSPVRPSTHSWNVALERQLPYSLSVDVAYVGNRADDQKADINLNAITFVGGQNAHRPYGSGAFTGVTAPFADTRILNPKTGLPFGYTGNLNAYIGFNKTRYNSLQVALSRPFRQGLLVKGHYTFAKQRSFSRTYAIPELADRNWQYGGREHNMTMAAVYQLPWQTGRGPGGLLRAVVNDWQVNAILAVYSGSRFSVSANGDDWNTADNPQRADLVGPVVKLGNIGPVGCDVCDSPGTYYDPAAWAQPTGQRLGTSRTNQFVGPGAYNLDLSVFRTIPIGGTRRVEIRVEGTNMLNTVKWANPDSDVSNPNTFMVIDGTTGNQREIRLALRFSY